MSPSSIKMWVLQPPTFQKEMPKLIFLVFSEQLLFHVIFWRIHCSEVTPVKSMTNDICTWLLRKSETTIFDQKKFYKKLVESQENKQLEARLNQVISKLLTLKAHSKVWNIFWHLKALLKKCIMLFISPLKALSILKIFKFLFWLFGHVGKRLD